MTIPPRSHHLNVIGRTAAPEAWSFEGVSRSFLGGAFEFVYRIAAAGDECVAVALPYQFMDEGVVGAIIALRREIDRRVAHSNRTGAWA